MSTVDVLITGAGPTGLLAAVDLYRHGLKPRVVEKHDGPSVHSKALAVQARSLELLEDLGLAEQATAAGNVVHGFNMYATGQRIVHLTLDELDSPFPYLLVLPQSDTERLLGGALEKLGGAVQWQHEVTHVEQDERGVTATIRGPDGSEEICRARWMVACEGAHSLTRELMNVPYEGEDIDAHFCFIDATVDWVGGSDEGHIFFHPDGLLAWIPLPERDRWRIIATMAEAPPKDDVGIELFARLAKERMHVEAKITESFWSASFTIRQRKIASYRKGRVFFAGDSAHCHSPVGGQGLNTGLQDAYNLAWKLALVERGVGRDTLLESYDAERAPIAKALLAGTGNATKVATLRHPVGQQLRNSVAGFLSSLDVVQQRLTRNVGELNLGYRHSPIVGQDRGSLLMSNVTADRTTEKASVADWLDFGSGPHPGDRAPDAEVIGADGVVRLYPLLHDTKHTLLLFDGHAATAAGYDNLEAIAAAMEARFSHVVSTHVVIPKPARREGLLASCSVLLDPDGHLHHRYGAGAECLYLIRPDIYVGYRCQPAQLDKLDAYLKTIFA